MREYELVAEFKVEGEPVGKARPRVTRWGTYTPTKTSNYEKLVIWSYAEKYKSVCELPLKVRIQSYFEIPKSWSKKKKELAREGKLLHTSRPDCDNLAKAVLDALNTVAYKDDSQICEIEVSKGYSVAEPYTSVEIYSIGG